MKLLFSSVLLGLAWFTVVNLLACGAARVFARRLLARESASANVLFATRLLPAAASASFVALVFLPTHWRFEPPETQESFGFLLGLLAVLGAAVIASGMWRAAGTLRASSRLQALARNGAVRIDADALQVQGFHGVALAGILRPTILVGAEAVAALSPAELAAAISHEVAHRRSGDNFKRFLMFCAPDLFGWSRPARNLEDRWQVEAECLADARAVAGDQGRAVVLASALVKVAKLTRRRGSLMPLPAWSAFHLAALLERRVRRLTSGAAAVPAVDSRAARLAAAGAALLAATAWLLDGAYFLHIVTEAMVTHLP